MFKIINGRIKVRGYPDLSANGANYVIAVDGSFSLVVSISQDSERPPHKFTAK